MTSSRVPMIRIARSTCSVIERPTPSRTARKRSPNNRTRRAASSLIAGRPSTAHPGLGGLSTASRRTAWWGLAPSSRAKARALSPSAIRSVAPRSMPAKRRASHGEAATS